MGCIVLLLLIVMLVFQTDMAGTYILFFPFFVLLYVVKNVMFNRGRKQSMSSLELMEMRNRPLNE